MQAIVKGVKIELTPAQIKQVEKQLNARKRCRTSFEKMLKHFGFKKVVDAGAGNNCWQHKSYNWFADVIDRVNYTDVWMTGTELKQCNGFPGGFCYGKPEEIEEELCRAIEKIENTK